MTAILNLSDNFIVGELTTGEFMWTGARKTLHLSGKFYTDAVYGVCDKYVWTIVEQIQFFKEHTCLSYFCNGI